MPELERTIERYVVNYAQQRGVYVTKLAAPGQRGMPDRAFWLKNGRVLLLEFKRPGGRLTALQHYVHGKLRGLGFDVHTISSREEGVRIITATIAAGG